MTDENKFFRYLWRINAVLIAGTGFLAVAFMVITGIGSGYHPDNFQLKPTEQNKPYEYALEPGSLASTGSGIATSDDASANVLEGTNEAYLFRIRKPVGENRRLVVSSTSYFMGVWPVNILILNSDTGVGRWLFSGDSRVIDALFEVHAQAPEKQAQNPVRGLLITATDADTDGDGALTDHDRQTLYAYRSGGAGVTKLLSADRIVSVTQADAGNVLVVYRNGPSAKDAVISASDLVIRAQADLPTPQNAAR